jgi:hypothetical protein
MIAAKCSESNSREIVDITLSEAISAEWPPLGCTGLAARHPPAHIEGSESRDGRAE